MYFADLTNYIYYRNSSFKEVFNIGWLELDCSFRSKKPNAEFLNKLGLLMKGSDYCDVHVNKIRSLHPCNICGEDNVREIVDEVNLLLGATEIWIPFDAGWFAAPSMILHYVSVHHYDPPHAFVNAVMKMRLDEKYIAQDVYDSLCREFSDE